MVLYSALSSPLDRSKRFTLSSPGRPVHSDTVLGFSWKHSSHAAIAQRLFTHISTTVYSQVLIYTDESTVQLWMQYFYSGCVLQFCCCCQDNLQILRDLSLLQIQMRDLEGYRVSSATQAIAAICKFSFCYFSTDAKQFNCAFCDTSMTFCTHLV